MLSCAYRRPLPAFINRNIFLDGGGPMSPRLRHHRPAERTFSCVHKMRNGLPSINRDALFNSGKAVEAGAVQFSTAREPQTGVPTYHS